DIVSSAEKVSFTYNGKAYEYTAGQSVEFIGDAQGFRPGKALSLKLPVSGEHVLVPMEICAEVFGYQLFYDQMGLAIFSDTEKIYDSAADFHKIYSLIESLAYNVYSGEELIRRMNVLYPNDEHTRLMASQDDFDRLKKLIETDPTYKAWFTRFSRSHDKNIENSTYHDALGFFELPNGFYMLENSRKVMNRIINLSLMYKLTDDEDYAKRVYRELYSMTTYRDPRTNCKSWHPEHLLDAGELMYGYAIGYDWCYDAFDEEDRVVLEEGVWELGFGPAFGWGNLHDWWQDPAKLAEYEKKVSEETGKPYIFNGFSGKNVYWYKSEKNGVEDGEATNNWNAVCNGGFTAIALAFANVKSDKYKEIRRGDPGYGTGQDYDFHYWSALLLDCINNSIPAMLKESYAPDGGYPEGPGYWSYGTTYCIKLFTSLLSATGTDGGRFNCPGFGESFYFICNLSSSAVGSWNYHDSGLGKADTVIFSVYARLSGDSNIGAYRYDNVTNSTYAVSYWDMVFYHPDNYAESINMTLDNYYAGVNTVTFRSSWDENAMFCGLHGGNNNASHGQLDIGNFILEYNGIRFFQDLGSDYYDLIGDYGAARNNMVIYFQMPFRHWLYRMRAEGHNTLIVNPTKVNINDDSTGTNQNGRNYDQLFYAVSEVLDFKSGNTTSYAVVDMGCAYLDARSGIRGMLVTNNRSTVIIQDEMQFTKSSEVYWMAHMADGAAYEVAADGQSAIVTVDGVSLLCTIVVPEGANYSPKFSVMAANYLPATGLTTQVGEYSREGMNKLMITTKDVTNYKLAVVCSLLSDGVYDYKWQNISEWTVD
ncbi:MAG: heparinase II/III family protein, partial [Clostridia bacterium]|nr:heparinase II/III family protein [Clostridia bacterium]